jgi:hypothetical protein
MMYLSPTVLGLGMESRYSSSINVSKPELNYIVDLFRINKNISYQAVYISFTIDPWG